MSTYRLIGQVGKVFASGPGDLGSTSGRVITKTLKMVLDTSLLSSLSTTRYVSGASGGVMVSKLDKQTYTSEFESHWVPLSYGLVPHLSKKKLSKLPLQGIIESKVEQSRERSSTLPYTPV